MDKITIPNSPVLETNRPLDEEVPVGISPQELPVIELTNIDIGLNQDGYLEIPSFKRDASYKCTSPDMGLGDRETRHTTVIEEKEGYTHSHMEKCNISLGELPVDFNLQQVYLQGKPELDLTILDIDQNQVGYLKIENFEIDAGSSSTSSNLKLVASETKVTLVTEAEETCTPSGLKDSLHGLGSTTNLQLIQTNDVKETNATDITEKNSPKNFHFNESMKETGLNFTASIDQNAICQDQDLPMTDIQTQESETEYWINITEQGFTSNLPVSKNEIEDATQNLFKAKKEKLDVDADYLPKTTAKMRLIQGQQVRRSRVRRKAKVSTRAIDKEVSHIDLQMNQTQKSKRQKLTQTENVERVLTQNLLWIEKQRSLHCNVQENQFNSDAILTRPAACDSITLHEPLGNNIDADCEWRDWFMKEVSCDFSTEESLQCINTFDLTLFDSLDCNNEDQSVQLPPLDLDVLPPVDPEQVEEILLNLGSSPCHEPETESRVSSASVNKKTSVAYMEIDFFEEYADYEQCLAGDESFASASTLLSELDTSFENRI